MTVSFEASPIAAKHAYSCRTRGSFARSNKIYGENPKLGRGTSAALPRPRMHSKAFPKKGSYRQFDFDALGRRRPPPLTTVTEGSACPPRHATCGSTYIRNSSVNLLPVRMEPDTFRSEGPCF
ncbi:hypothetical protein EVAR_6195_1 [Eumeta japonica]|uniref:Uncharacterized protein n=1 Tax=Eumeta variegata TaxID=151549 RepID=A0A4C2A5T9_EUMVA|nr:hypothetical protein EVAR_6195_1 [Eumeta japonica]